MYEQLSKLYYKDANKYVSEFDKRINSYGTIRLPFSIKPMKSSEDFTCFYVNHSSLDLLHDQISKQSKMIQKIVNDLPPIAVQQYVRAKLVDELLSTNEIEGVRSTKVEMETVLEIVVQKEVFKKPKIRHLSLMNSYYNLLSETVTSVDSIEEIRKIYDDLIQEEIKEKDKLDGDLFRKEAVDVITATDKVVHKGVYPESAIQTHLNNMLTYLNHNEVPMLYKIAIAHYYFGYIHPFYDGNGRTSRYISSMYLLKELDRLSALTLSYSTNKNRQLYYDAFTESNNPLNKGELTFFCETFFQIINKAQNDVLVELSQKRNKLRHLAYLVRECNLEEKLGKNLYIIGQNFIFGIEGKGISQSELKSELEMSTYSVRTRLEELEKKGLIEYLKRRPVEVTINENWRNILQ